MQTSSLLKSGVNATTMWRIAGDTTPIRDILYVDVKQKCGVLKFAFPVESKANVIFD
jgi:hypothetical protein